MSVVIETTIGDFTVDLYTKERPRTCMNFLKLCKLKYYNLQLFFKVAPNFVCQAGDPTLSGKGGESLFSHLYGDQARFFEAENQPRLKHLKLGTLSMVDNGEGMLGSQFLITLSDNLDFLDERHCVFGEVVEGMEFLQRINEVICDKDERPLQDIMISHTVVLDDPFAEPENLEYPASPDVTLEKLKSDRIACYEDVDDYQGRTAEEIEEALRDKEAKAQATMLEIIGDLPDADMAPPENVLFVCKLNPVTNDDDLELIFSRFGEIKSCEVIRDWKSQESLQYAFIEFAQRESCEQAYFKMDNVLIDDRRIHVDFSQSVAKVKWKGKGRGVVGNWSENEKKNQRFDERPREKYVVRDNRRKDGYQLILGGDSEGRQSAKKYRRSTSPDDRRTHRERSPAFKNRRRTPPPRDRRLSSAPRDRRKSPSSRERRRSPSPRNRRKSPSPKNRRRSPSPRERKRSQSPRDRKDRDRRSRSRDRHPKSKGGRSESGSRADRESKWPRDDRSGKHRSRSRDRERSNRKEEQSRRRSRSRDRDHHSKKRR